MRRSIARKKKAIAHHYDVSNEFYRLFLGEEMVYSCAYFRLAGLNIDQAQRDKLGHICAKLRLKKGEKLLDIGCGWGGLIVWAAKHFGVQSHGITLSRKQYEYARQRIEQENLGHLCRVELKDYRELKGEALYDKIASVGMFEHVGISNYPEYFGAVSRLLKDKGFFLNHGIVTEVIGKKTTAATRFITTYVFPDSELDNIAHVQYEMKRAGFEILDVESLRQHYAKTLEHWVRNLEKEQNKARALVEEKIYRIWRVYMAASSYGFSRGNISVYQILASKHGTPGPNQHPLTREDLYATWFS